MELSDVLGVVEHELRGIAATVGTLARLLTDGRLAEAEQPAAYQRLQRASERIEKVAADARLLAAWTQPEGTLGRRWRLAAMSATVEAALAGDDVPFAVDQADAWRRSLIRVSEDGAFDVALRGLVAIARRELGDGIAMQARLSPMACEIYFGPPDVRVWDDTRVRTPLTPGPGGLVLLVTLAVLTGHGADTWRGPENRGVGASIPVAAADSK